METKEKKKTQLEILKERLHRMLESSNGLVTEEIVEVSQALDEIILLETKKYNYNKKK